MEGGEDWGGVLSAGRRRRRRRRRRERGNGKEGGGEHKLMTFFFSLLRFFDRMFMLMKATSLVYGWPGLLHCYLALLFLFNE